MRVGIVVPAYDCGPYVVETVRSALAQDRPAARIVVVDDGSTDDTWERLQGLADEVELVRQDNVGAAAARRRGAAELGADVDALLFLDADDVLEPAMLEHVAGALEQRPDAGGAFCRLRLVDEAGAALDQPLPWRPRLVPEGRRGLRELGDDEPVTPFFSVLAQAAVIPSVTLLRRTAYEAAGGFDPAFGQPFEDMNLFLEVTLRAPLVHVPEVLVRHRRRGGQSTGSRERTAAQEARLYARWRDVAAFAPEHRPAIAAALEAYDRRLVPRVGLAAARRHLREGRPLEAARFAGGALRRAAGR